VIPQEGNAEQSFQGRSVEFVGTKLERCGSFVQPTTFTYPWKVEGKRGQEVITLISERRNGRTYIKSVPRFSGMGACASDISNPASGPGSRQDTPPSLMDRLGEGIDATEFYSSLICKAQARGNRTARTDWSDGTNNSARDFELHAPCSYGIPTVGEEPTWKALGALANRNGDEPVRFPAVAWSFVPKSGKPAETSASVDTMLIVAPAALSVFGCGFEGEDGMSELTMKSFKSQQELCSVDLRRKADAKNGAEFDIDWREDVGAILDRHTGEMIVIRDFSKLRSEGPRQLIIEHFRPDGESTTSEAGARKRHRSPNALNPECKRIAH
jgi:hypothetical protein